MPEQALPPHEALALARDLLDRGRPFFAHDVLEAVWKVAPAAERDLWQGLVQVCVGLTHLQRGNDAGGARLLRRGAERLEQVREPRPYGVDPAHVSRQAVRIADAVESGGSRPSLTL